MLEQSRGAREGGVRFRQLQPLPEEPRGRGPTTGTAAPARAISTSARTGWCISARSSAGVRAFRSSSTAPTICGAEYHRVKGCAPFCTVGCVHRVAQVDELRDDPQRTLAQWFAAPVQGRPPHFPLPGQDPEVGVRHQSRTRALSQVRGRSLRRRAPALSAALANPDVTRVRSVGQGPQDRAPIG